MPADISSGPAEALINGWMADDPATTTAFSGKVPQSWARLSRATVTAPTRTSAHTMLVRLMPAFYQLDARVEKAFILRRYRCSTRR